MRSAKTARTIAVGGIASILIGAVLLIAPPSAGADPGNLTCNDLLDEAAFTSITEIRDDHGREAPFPADGVSFHEFTDNGITIKYKLDLTGVTFKEATAPIYAVYIKQASGAQDKSVSATFGGVTGGFVAYTEGEFSHILFCTGTPVTTTTSTTSTTTSTTSTSTTTTTAPPAPEVEVEGDEEVAPTTAAPTTAAAVEVKGATVTRTLPRTGSGAGHLATAGIALMIFGGILVGGSRRALLGNS